MGLSSGFLWNREWNGIIGVIDLYKVAKLGVTVDHIFCQVYVCNIDFEYI